MPRRSLSLWMCIGLSGMLTASAHAQTDLIGPPVPPGSVAHGPGAGPTGATSTPNPEAKGAKPDALARERAQGLGSAASGDGSRPKATGTPGSIVDSVVRNAAALAGVVGLAFAARWITRRVPRLGGGLGGALGAAGRAPSGVLSVLGRYPTGGGQQLVLLRLDRRVLLLSQAGGRGRAGGPAFRTLAEVTDAEEVASIIERTEDEGQTSLKSRFQGLLQRFGGSEEYASNAEFPASRQVVYGEDGDRAELLDDQSTPDGADAEGVGGMEALSQRLARYRAGRGGATWSA